MKSVAENVSIQADDAASKVAMARSHPWRFVAAAMLAGLWIGGGVYVMFSVAGPFYMAGSLATKLVSGAVFAIALTFVVFAGGQLATSAMMTLPIGALRKAISWWQATWVLLVIMVGNLVGSLLLAWVLLQTGIFSAPATQGMLDGAVTARLEQTPAELFFRGIMCNILVCGAIWAASRVKSEAAKAIILFWGVFAFISSGFEHVVANMTIFGLGLVGAGTVSVSLSAFGTMLLWVGLGNLVGGMVVIGMGYLFVGGPYAKPQPKVGATTSESASALQDERPIEPAPAVSVAGTLATDAPATDAATADALKTDAVTAPNTAEPSHTGAAR